MPIYHNVNGIERDTWSVQTNVNGVWRDVDQFVNVNGVFRQSYKAAIEEADIVGFRFVYKRLDSITHDNHPDLVVNHNLPVTFNLTGETFGNMDLEQKGVVFEYDRINPEQEGICVYKGDLYAVLTNDLLVNVGLTRSKVIPDDRIPGVVPNTTTGVWCSNKLEHLRINIDGYILYESNGYAMDGWNSLFSKTQFLDPTDYPDEMDYKKLYQLNSYNILPLSSRDELFDSSAYIGIARDMHSKTNNMVGSYGAIDHSVSRITVNDVAKPFVFEIYN